MRSAYRIVSDHYAASSRGDLAGMLADMDERTEWTEMAGFRWPAPMSARPPSAPVCSRPLQRDWEGFRVEIERLIDGGDSVVAVGRYAATHRRSGKSFEARVAHVWTVEDGRIRRFEQFCDTLLVDRATR
ncbi:nuclear transport factor 2 family protein [Pseudomonas aeruginosa]|nr:nuclear transport factor 2 family protein [Pseudomonas aeruginosa]